MPISNDRTQGGNGRHVLERVQEVDGDEGRGWKPSWREDRLLNEDRKMRPGV
jgi:hypothetical protein